MIQSHICTIGDELLIGQITDSNAAFIAGELNKTGVMVTQIHSVGDRKEAIWKLLDESLQQADLLVLTGGLGPTRDDITKNTLAFYTGSSRFYRSEAQETHIVDIFEKRGRMLLEIDRKQADVPETCKVIENKLGTAPGMWFDYKGKVIVSLPGVPYEMEGIFPLVTQAIQHHFSTSLSPIIHQNIATFGIPESALAHKIADWERALPSELRLAYLPNPCSGVRLRMSCYDIQGGSQLIEQAINNLKPILGNSVYSLSDQSLAEVVGALLIQEEATVATAESCTGGKIAAMLTAQAGASAYYLGSILAYHNRIKEELLEVPADLLHQYGAVCSECVEAMAQGAKKRFGADFAVATSGIAGPSGGSLEKPVGTLWVAVATPQKCTAQKFVFSGNRLINIDRFAAAALNMLRLSILETTTYK